MEYEKKRILVKFFAIILLVASIIFLIKMDVSFMMMGLVLFIVAMIVLIFYNLNKRKHIKNKK